MKERALKRGLLLSTVRLGTTPSPRNNSIGIAGLPALPLVPGSFASADKWTRNVFSQRGIIRMNGDSFEIRT